MAYFFFMLSSIVPFYTIFILIVIETSISVLNKKVKFESFPFGSSFFIFITYFYLLLFTYYLLLFNFDLSNLFFRFSFILTFICFIFRENNEQGAFGRLKTRGKKRIKDRKRLQVNYIWFWISIVSFSCCLILIYATHLFRLFFYSWLCILFYLSFYFFSFLI